MKEVNSSIENKGRFTGLKINTDKTTYMKLSAMKAHRKM